jgi:hypothetical protein
MEIVVLRHGIYWADLVNAWLLNFGGHGEGSGEAGTGFRSAAPRRESAERFNGHWLHSPVTINQLS